MTDSTKILRPLPQRSWQPSPASTTTPSTLATPSEPPQDERSLTTNLNPSRTRSILNLTSSTLLGIYQSGSESVQESVPGTPWGTGTMTPASPSSPIFGESEKSYNHHTTATTALPASKAFRKRTPIDLVGRSILLFFAGLGYGIFISRLHDNPHIAPVRVEGVSRDSWRYVIYWGVAGALAGNLIPWLEMLLGGDEVGYVRQEVEEQEQESETVQTTFWNDWSQPLRGIGVFIGIAYAIRRLPWESSSQAALTLALTNPGLWYLVDRSRIGFIISTTYAIAGTFLLLAVNPDLIPQPSDKIDGNLTAFERIQVHGVYSTETVGVFVWIASVVFCSCVCFRSLGKRLLGVGDHHIS